MSHLLCKHPWLLLILCFGILITAWSSLITIAVKCRPDKVEMTHRVDHQP